MNKLTFIAFFLLQEVFSYRRRERKDGCEWGADWVCVRCTGNSCSAVLADAFLGPQRQQIQPKVAFWKEKFMRKVHGRDCFVEYLYLCSRRKDSGQG